MKGPTVRSSQTVYSGYFDLRKDQLIRSDGETMDYTSLYLPWDAAIIIPEDQNGLLILSREYRHPTGQFILGFPGGGLEKGEDPQAGAKRELFEETGYWSDELRFLGCCYPLPSLCNQKIYFFHAKNATFKGNHHSDPFEFIETELKTEEALRREIQSGLLVDGILCSALWYKSLSA